MKIIKRCKDENGHILWYKVLGFNNNIAVLSKIDTITLASRDLIDNATLLNNGTFRAKPGYSIETVLRNTCSREVHNYFDFTKLYKFRAKKSLEGIEKDLTEKYKITNIANNKESLQAIVNTLAWDYINYMANYEGYIEKGINARVLIELRKSAILPIENWDEFYTGHNALETAEDIRFYRTKMLKKKIYNYTDWDWDYYNCFRKSWMRTEAYRIDFENCYADGDATRQISTQDYIDGRLKDKYIRFGIIRSEQEFTPQVVAENEPGLKFGFVPPNPKPGEDYMDNGKALIERLTQALQEREQQRKKQNNNKNK